MPDESRPPTHHRTGDQNPAITTGPIRAVTGHVAVGSQLTQLGVFVGSFDQEAVEAVIQDVDEVEESARLLYRRSLVDYRDDRYTVHDLVRACAAARLGDEESHTTRLRHAYHYIQIACRSEERSKAGQQMLLDGLVLFDRERSQIDASWTWVQQQPLVTESAKLRLACRAGITYVGELRYDTRRERLPQLEHALAATRYLRDLEQETITLAYLGCAYYRLREIRWAIARLEHALQLAQQIAYKRGEELACGNLGSAYYCLSDLEHTVTYSERALDIKIRQTLDRRSQVVATHRRLPR